MTKLIGQFTDVVVGPPRVVLKHKKVAEVQVNVTAAGRSYLWTLGNPVPPDGFAQIEGRWSDIKIREETDGYGFDKETHRYGFDFIESTGPEPMRRTIGAATFVSHPPVAA